MLALCIVLFAFVIIRSAKCFAEPCAGNTLALVASLIIFGLIVVGSLESPAYV